MSGATYCAVTMGRIGMGIELKPSYFEQAVRNLDAATGIAAAQDVTLFDVDHV